MGNELPYRLVAFDLDNTVLDRGAMSKETKRALRELKRKGTINVAATGRHISLIPDSIRRNRSIDYIICVTGASVYERKTRKMTYLWQMTAEEAHLAIASCKSANARLNLVTRERAFAEKAAFTAFIKTPAVKGQTHEKSSIGQILRLLRLVLVSSLMDDAAGYLDEHPTALVEKIDAFFDLDEETAQAVRLLEESGRFEIAQSPRYLEITAKNCTKGNGIRWLCESLGLAKRDVIAFGDSGNDLSMLEHTGLFVAMGNAEPAVLERAGRIAPGVKEDGFAAVVRDVFSI